MAARSNTVTLKAVTPGNKTYPSTEGTSNGATKRPRKIHVKRGAVEKKVLSSLKRHPLGLLTRVLVVKGEAICSTEGSVKQCLRRLAKQGKIHQTKAGFWRLVQMTDEEIRRADYIPGVKDREGVLPARRTDMAEMFARSYGPSTPEAKELVLAHILAGIRRNPKDRLDRIEYLASLIGSGLIQVRSPQLHIERYALAATCEADRPVMAKRVK